MALSFSFVLVVLVVFLFLWYFRVGVSSSRLKFFFWFVVIFLLYLSVTNVFLSEPIDFSSPRSVVSAVGVYVKWLGQTLSNLWDVGRDTTGNVVKAVQHNVTS